MTTTSPLFFGQDPNQPPPALVIRGPGPDHQQLLTVRVVDGQLVADYRPEDLDAAAQRFADAVRGLFARPTKRLDAAPGDRMLDGGVWGTLVRCPQCSGDGLLHQPDHPPAPGPTPTPEVPPGVPVSPTTAALAHAVAEPDETPKVGAFDIARKALLNRYGTLDPKRMLALGADAVEIGAAGNIARRDRDGV